jgi:hypothetical protein
MGELILRLLLPSVLLGGCSGAPAPGNSMPSQIAKAETVVQEQAFRQTYRSSSASSVAQGIEGAVEYENGCLYLRQSGLRFLLFFREDTVSRAPDGIVTFGSRRLEPGTRLSLTGSARLDVPEAGWPENRIEGCEYTNTFHVAGGVRSS